LSYLTCRLGNLDPIWQNQWDAAALLGTKTKNQIFEHLVLVGRSHLVSMLKCVSICVRVGLAGRYGPCEPEALQERMKRAVALLGEAEVKKLVEEQVSMGQTAPILAE
jgi:hypothetical protein